MLVVTRQQNSITICCKSACLHASLPYSYITLPDYNQFPHVLLQVLDSLEIAVVVEGSDGVVNLAIAHQMGLAGVSSDKRDDLAWFFHEGLTLLAEELDLAGRVDWVDFQGLHVQDNPVGDVSTLVADITTQDAEFILANLAHHYSPPRINLAFTNAAPSLRLFITTFGHAKSFN